VWSNGAGADSPAESSLGRLTNSSKWASKVLIHSSLIFQSGLAPKSVFPKLCHAERGTNLKTTKDSNFARDAFSTFIPISVDSDARTRIIMDFFDLLAAVAAHGKKNGLGGRKLSRYAGWWAFEHEDTGSGFEAAYKNWAR
jgi:hypothetical protein